MLIFLYAFNTNKENIMATSQSQSEKIVKILEDQKEIAEKLRKTVSEGTIMEEEIRKEMYKQYRKIEQIMQLVDGQVIYDWDEYFMSVACLAALRSKDPSTPVRYYHYYTVK